MTERAELEAALEAILFVSSEPVPRERLLEVFTPRERALAEEALDVVVARYRRPDDSENGRGVMIDEAGGGLRLVTRPDLHGYLKTFFEISGSNRLSMAALETLAIVAYRQPVTAPEIQELRGKNSSGVLKTLLERRLVRLAGRKDVVGKPFLYATTRDFLLLFGLQSIQDLPPLEEFEETFLLDGEIVGASGADREEEVLQQLALVEESEQEQREEREQREAERTELAAALESGETDGVEDGAEHEAEHEAEDGAEGEGEDAGEDAPGERT